VEKIKFKDFIQFAIAKEIGTAHFYTQAAEKAKNSETEELLLQFAREEEGHQRVLETLTVEKIDHVTIERMPSLPRSKDAGVTEYRPGMSYAEIVKMAIAMEEQAFNLYDSLRGTADDDDLKNIFTFLAKEEAKHRARFEELYAEEISK
jgi:rubrerythrin